MSKQDTTFPRTAHDLQRQYQFGRSFAEILGIAEDARNTAVKAEETALKIQQQALDIDVVEKLNASAKVITLNSNRLIVNSDNFSLKADGTMTAKRGVVGKWDISDESGISKITDNFFVKISSPETDSDDVITVSKIENGAVTAVPFCLKADGSLFAKFGGVAGFNITENGLEYCESEEPDEYGFRIEDRTEYSTGHVLCETKFISNDIAVRVQSTKITPHGLMYSLTGSEILAPTEITFGMLTVGNTSYSLYADLNEKTVKVR